MRHGAVPRAAGAIFPAAGGAAGQGWSAVRVRDEGRFRYREVRAAGFPGTAGGGPDGGGVPRGRGRHGGPRGPSGSVPLAPNPDLSAQRRLPPVRVLGAFALSSGKPVLCRGRVRRAGEEGGGPRGSRPGGKVRVGVLGPGTRSRERGEGRSPGRPAPPRTVVRHGLSPEAAVPGAVFAPFARGCPGSVSAKPRTQGPGFDSRVSSPRSLEPNGTCPRRGPRRLPTPSSVGAFPRAARGSGGTMDPGARPAGSCGGPAGLSREYKLVMLGAGGVGKSGRWPVPRLSGSSGCPFFRARDPPREPGGRRVVVQGTLAL